MPFVRFVPLRSSTTSTRYLAWDTGNAAVGTENGARAWLPLATTVSEGTGNCTTALTSTQRYDMDFQVALVTTGSLLQLTSATGAGLSVRGTMGATLPKFVTDATVTSPQRHLASILKQNTPPNQNVRFAFAYNVTDAEDVAWFAAGDDASNLILTSPAADRFIAFEWSGTGAGGGSTTTQSVSQVPWPATGSFKYALCRSISTDPFTLALQVNGADVITLSCPASATGVFTSDATTQAAIVKGQPVNWRYRRTSGSNTTIQFEVVVGFSGVSG